MVLILVFTYSYNLSNGTVVAYCCKENLIFTPIAFRFFTSLGYQKISGLEGKSSEITNP